MNETVQSAPQGGERVTKKFELPCSIYDAPSIEVWLTEQGKDGWRLCDWAEENIPMPTFVKGEAQERQYWLEPAQKDAPPSAEEILRYEVMGWAYICRSQNGIFRVWRAAKPTAQRRRFYTDKDGHAYRTVKKQIRKGGLLLAAKCLAALAFALVTCYLQSEGAVVWALIADVQIGLGLTSAFLAVLSDFLAGRRERKDMKRLLTSLWEGEPMQFFGYGKATKRVFGVLSFVLLSLTFTLLFLSGEDIMSDNYDYADHPVPFIGAEAFGGAAGDRCVSIRRTTLGGEITLVGEGAEEDFRWNGQWRQYDTQLEIYELQLASLAEPLARDTAKSYFLDAEIETFCEDGFTVQYCARIPRFYYDGVTKQGILLCDGGVLLYYHTDAPDDLRTHLDEFKALLRQYQND